MTTPSPPPASNTSDPNSQRGPSPASAGRKTPQQQQRKPRQNSAGSGSGSNRPTIDPSKANQRPNNSNNNNNQRGGHHSRRSSSNSRHNPKNSDNGMQPHRRSGSSPMNNGSTNTTNNNNTTNSALPQMPNMANQPMSTLNPNAGGFQPGGLSALAEVQNEVLVTPTTGHFDFGSISSALSGIDPAHQAQGAVTSGYSPQDSVYGAGGGAASVGSPQQPATPSSLAAQVAQLQQLQMMQQSMGGVSPQQQQQLLDMQSNLLNQIQLAQSSQAPNIPNNGATSTNANLPPRFAATQQQQQSPQAQQPLSGLPSSALFGNMQQPQPGQDMSALMNEQMAIQEQLEMLKAQQQNLLDRFANMQGQPGQPQHQQQPSPVPQENDEVPPPPSFGNVPRAGHRRHQSQQVAGMASMGQFATGMPAPVGFGGNQQQQQLPKGHGRRHSVNVVSKQPGGGQQQQQGQQAGPLFNREGSPTLMMSGPGANRGGFGGSGNGFQFPYSQQQQQQHQQQQPQPGGHHSAAPSVDFGTELDFGASPASGQTGTSTGMSSAVPPPVAGSGSGFVPGHRSRESRSSISSLSGWGTNSGQYVQNAIPSATATDLAQATQQLQQLSTFRASAGHAKVPSFGMSNSQNFYGSGNNQPGNNQQRKSLFAPYLPAASIPPLVAAGRLVIGTLRVNKRNRSDAYVASDTLECDIYICGSKDRNRALEGDVVAVELLDVDEVWGTKKEKELKKLKKEENASYDPRASQHIRKQDKKNDDVEVEGQGLTLFDEEEVTDDQRPQFAGHVVGVVHRAPGQLFAGTLGVLRPSSAATKEKQEAERREREGVDLRNKPDSAPVRIVWLRPVDKRVPLLAIPVNEAPEDFVDNPDKYANHLFCACIKRWPITSLHPFGTLVEELGPIGDIETETSALMKDCNFSVDDFNETVLKCLPPIPYSIPPREYEVRKDLRDTRIFSIDPSTAKDLDDALHITKKDDGTFEVGVHIADVSHFVKPNTALDREAKKRATTVYLVQRAYPMLPAALSENVCSLTPGEEKLAFSVIFTLTPEARVLSTWYGKSIIKSCAKLSYDDAQAAITGQSLPDAVEVSHQAKADVTQDVIDLMGLAGQMRARRFDDNGALRIDNIKLGFSLDESGIPQDCHVQEGMESKHLIEEFMLLANISVAQRIAAGMPDHAMLRRHEDPIDRRLEAFARRAKTLDINIDVSSSGALMQSLNAVTDPQAKFTLKVLSIKAMKKARYFCSGMLDIAKYRHYALNVPLYTHFTSPIRRYADVMVHRQLEAVLMGAADTKFPIDPESVSQIAQHCNAKKEAATLAQEQSQHLFLCTMINNLTLQYGPVVRTAQIIGVLDEAFDVVVPDFGIEKRVHVEQMPVENHVYDEHRNTLALYWKKGVDVVKWLAENSGDAHLQHVKQTAERHASMMEASTTHASDEQKLFEDDESPPQIWPESDQHKKSADKAYPSFEGTEVTPTGHHIHTIKELQKVPVIITADVTKSPPVLKVISLNPFP